MCYPTVLESSSEHDKRALGILCTNKQIRNEALENLLHNCEMYFLNRDFQVLYEEHKHHHGKGMRLPKKMYQNLRTIWITTAHLKSWTQHAVLKALNSLALVNVEHNMTGNKFSGYDFRHLTCVSGHGTNPLSIVNDHDRNKLINLSLQQITGCPLRHEGWLNSVYERIGKPLKRRAFKPGDLQVRIHFRCPACRCEQHCHYGRTIQKAMVCSLELASVMATKLTRNRRSSTTGTQKNPRPAMGRCRVKYMA